MCIKVIISFTEASAPVVLRSYYFKGHWRLSNLCVWQQHLSYIYASVCMRKRGVHVYGSVCVFVCRLLQLLKDESSASYRLLVMFTWILIRGFAK